MFYNTYRTTKSAQKQRELKASSLSKVGSNIVNPKERLINLQKREKLKGLLITKFMKKYGIKDPEKILEDEITKFLQGEKLNDADLQRLDAKIHRLLIEKKNKTNLKASLTDNTKQNQPQPVQAQPQEEPKIEKPVTPGQTACNQEKQKVNHCSQTAPIGGKKPRNIKYKTPEEELAELEAEEEACKPHYERIDFAKDGDEWNAMAQYNRKLFEEEKLNEKLKDKEVKRRTKEDLDSQIKQKLKREYEENLKNKEQDKLLLAHLAHLEELEKEKKEKLKQQVLKEKLNRDAQMKDEATRKRLEVLREKKFDRELIKHLLEDMEADKQKAIEKRKKENEALQKTLKENELHRIKMAELAKKEREDDIRTQQEHALCEQKRENERILYFKNIEKNVANFMSGTAKKTLDDLEKQRIAEDEKMKQLTIEQEQREREEDERRKVEDRENKLMMRKYLLMQMEEKKKMQEFEKMMDAEQARIWNVDCKKYYEDEKAINSKIKKMNKNNLDCVMNQIKLRNEKKSNANRMTPTEYAMNRDFIEKNQATAQPQANPIPA